MTMDTTQIHTNTKIKVFFLTQTLIMNKQILCGYSCYKRIPERGSAGHATPPTDACRLTVPAARPRLSTAQAFLILLII